MFVLVRGVRLFTLDCGGRVGLRRPTGYSSSGPTCHIGVDLDLPSIGKAKTYSVGDYERR
jgi:hypothetical protein